MAKMDQYQAYQEQPQGIDLIGDVALAPFKPSTQLWMYGHMPSLWSGTKGVHIPFNIDAGKKTWGAVKTAFDEKRYIASAGNLFKMGGAVRPFGTGGTRIGAYTGDRTQNLITSATRKSARYQKFIANQELRLKFTNDLVSEAQAKVDWVKYRPMGKSTKQATLKKVAQQRAKKLAGPQYDLSFLTGEKIGIQNQMSKAQRALTRQQKRAAMFSSKLVGQNAAKWALRAGKVAASAGAVMFAMDIARMIGEPVGRAIVSQADNALQQYEDRFMPELGGRLEMTYLTRGAATERQRALQAMSKAQITGRSGFGQEAKYVSR